jgi:hypothetical protein
MLGPTEDLMRKRELVVSFDLAVATRFSLTLFALVAAVALSQVRTLRCETRT